MPATQAWITCEGGRFPLLYSSPIRWTFREGVTPVEEEFDMVPNHADQIMATSPNQPVTLTIQIDGVTPLVIKNLWVEGRRDSAVKFISRIKLSDRRRFLKYGNVLGRYNIRREVGINRIAATAQQVIQPVVPKIWFAPYSLKGYAPNRDVTDTDRWKVTEMIDDVMVKAMKTEKDYNKGSVPGYTIMPEVSQLNSAMSFEGLQIDDSADFAVQRALQYIPEIGITVDKEGQYVIFAKTSGKDTYYANLIQPELENRGHLTLVSNKNIRPGKIEVFFTIKCELRFDYIEPGDSGHETVVANSPDARLLDNVGPSPDWTMNMGDENVVQGTWKKIEDYLAYWTPRSPWGSALTKTFLQKAMVPYLDLWGPFLLTGLSSPNVDWAARAAMLDANYRKTFRIPQRWMNNIFQVFPERVGIWDQATGSSGPAEAYCNYAKIASQRAFWRSKEGGRAGPSQKGEWAVNVRGYPQGGAAPWNGSVQLFDSNTKPVPADVTMIDTDQGIFHLNWKADQFRLYEIMVPSRIVRADGSEFRASADWEHADDHPVSFDAVFDSSAVPQLEANQKIAVLLSAIPASPNDLRQLFKVTVEPGDVKDLVPQSAVASLNNCSGPTWQIRVGGGMDGARAMIAWNDSRYSDIEKLFGVQDGDPNLDDLILNYQKPSGGRQTASLTTIAKAVAARVWTRYCDRYQGAAEGRLNPDVTVDGWVGGVWHAIDGAGVASTGIVLPESLPDLPWYSILDSSTRAILFREGGPRK